MIGSVVGVGIFGLPYAFAQSGWVLGAVILLGVGLLILTMQLMFAEVVEQTPGLHRVTGYVRVYLGERWAKVALLALATGIWGALLAYIIVGGQFLRILLEPLLGGTDFVYSLLLGLLVSILIVRDLKFISRLDMVFVGILLFLFVFIILSALPQVEVKNIIDPDWSKFFITYGVALFSLGSVSIIPEMKVVLGTRQKQKLGWAVLLAMSTIILLYLFFSFAVVGVTGSGTTSSALAGLVPVLGDSFRIIGALLGMVTIVSIYMILGMTLRNTFCFDFKMPKRSAWLLVCGVPLLLFAFGMREFISVVEFVGTVFGGIYGTIIILTYLRMRQSPVCRLHRCFSVPRAVSWLLIAVFLAGMVWEMVGIFSK